MDIIITHYITHYYIYFAFTFKLYAFTLHHIIAFITQIIVHVFTFKFPSSTSRTLSLCSSYTFPPAAQLVERRAPPDVAGSGGARFEPRRARFRARIEGYLSTSCELHLPEFWHRTASSWAQPEPLLGSKWAETALRLRSRWTRTELTLNANWAHTEIKLDSDWAPAET